MVRHGIGGQHVAIQFPDNAAERYRPGTSFTDQTGDIVYTFETRRNERRPSSGGVGSSIGHALERELCDGGTRQIRFGAGAR